jgi:cell division protein FtsL
MKEIVEAVLKFLCEFTFRRFFAVVILLIIGTLAIVGYEHYTGNFEIKKLERTVALLKTLNYLKKEKIEESPKLKKVYNQAIANTEQLLIKKTFVLIPELPKSSGVQFWKKILASIWFWLIMTVFMIPGAIKNWKEDGNALLGMAVFAILSGLVGLLIPAWWWPWLHAAIYPLIQIVALIVFIVIIAIKSKNNKNKTEEK